MPVATTKDLSRNNTADIMEWQAGESSGSGLPNTLKRKADLDLKSESSATVDIEMVDVEDTKSPMVKPGKASPSEELDVLDMTNLPSSPASSSFPSNVTKRAKPCPPSSSRAKPKKGDKDGPSAQAKDITKGKGKTEKKSKAKNGSTAKAETTLKSGIVTLNKKKKTFTIDQSDVSSVVSSYTPFMTLLVQFHDHLYTLPIEDSETKKKNKLEDFPDEYRPLVIMLGQDSGLAGPRDLARYIKGKMKPAVMSEDEQVVEIDLTGLTKLIEETFDQVCYGVAAGDIAELLPNESISPSLEIPSGLRLTRWEAKDLGLVPQKEGAAGKGRMGLRDLFEDRRTKRSEVKKTVMDMLKGLETAELKDLLGVDDGVKEVAVTVKEKEKAKEMDVEVEVVDIDAQGVTSGDVDMEAVEVVEVIEKKKPARKPKEETEEQRSKRLAKEEKVKKKAEVEEKAAQEKQRAAQMMSSFFGRAPASSPVKGESRRDRSASRSSRGSSIQLSDFCAEFKPFHQGLNVSLAPVDRFRLLRPIAEAPRGRSGQRNGEELEAKVENVDGAELTKEYLMKDMRAKLSSLGFDRTERAGLLPGGSSSSQSRTRKQERKLRYPVLPLPPPPVVPSLHLKTRVRYYPVPLLIEKANETGDGEEARRVYKAFEDKRLYWRKTLKFWEDSRPAYEGTWTKPSLTVGPRTPFAQDNALDYSIDEGIEWEAEDPAEVELSSTLDEDEEAETEDEDEEDDWMVGDDEIEFEEGAEGYIDAQGSQKKEPQVVEDYYTEVGKAGAVSRNQRFTRLVPFQKGPCLETRLGEVDTVMDKYKICMLNDTPMHSIDPFTFQSVAFEEISATPKPSIPTLQTTLVGNVVKPGSPAAAGLKPTTQTTASFPSGTLAEFLKAIQGCEKTKEAMLQDLYAQFKSATTQKVIKHTFGLVADREKGRSGRWIVKNEAWSQAGVTPPAMTSQTPSVIST